MPSDRETNNPELLRMTDMPSGPWQKVHLDFYGPLPSREHLLVCIDRYSRYPEVEILRPTKAASVIPRLDKIFSVHGLPHQVISDNGPPFNSTEFARYMDTLGIKFDPTTPKWPQENAEVERFMQPLGKAIQTAHAENKVWQLELCRFLLQYRSTPHSTTQVPTCWIIIQPYCTRKTPNTRFNTFQKRIPRVPRIFCSSLELENFDQKPNGDGKRWSVYSKVYSHFHQRYSLFFAFIIRSIRKLFIRILILDLRGKKVNIYHLI